MKGETNVELTSIIMVVQEKSLVNHEGWDNKQAVKGRTKEEQNQS